MASTHTTTTTNNKSLRDGVAAVDLDAFHMLYPDVTLTEPPLQTSRHGGVYKSTSKKYGNCICKVMSTTGNHVDSLRNEYHRLLLCRNSDRHGSSDSDSSNNNHSIVRALDLYDNPSSLYAVLLTEDVGPSLAMVMADNNDVFSSAPKTVIQIGIQVATALDYLHRHARFIHSDVNPTNICFTAGAGNNNNKATLIDFGACHGFSEPIKSFTPAFQSPEQARGIVDHRSDLYSLGVVLFALYTGGRLPVGQGATKPEEYRMAHMLQEPLSLSDCTESSLDHDDCHPMWEQILARLLTKNADVRYQTAAALIYDLQQLLDVWDDDPYATFVLDSHEIPFTLTLPTNLLVGRQTQMETLTNVYQQCLQQPDKGALCYLEGKPGVGKTALVNALASQKRNPFFLHYKFNQYGVRPMHAIVEVMTTLAQQIVSSNIWYDHTNIRQVFVQKLCDCDVMQALVDLVPAYGEIIQSQISSSSSSSSSQEQLQLLPLPQGLSKTDTTKTLFPAIAQVLRATRRILLGGHYNNHNNNGDHGGDGNNNNSNNNSNGNITTTTTPPICLFLDDVQWMDPGSKNALVYLLEENLPIFTIVCFRDASSQNTFVINTLLDRYSPNALPAMGIQLHEFCHADIVELLGHLALPDSEKTTLSQLLLEQTGGNQFYTRFRLGIMAETGALHYDVDQRCWRLDPTLADAAGVGQVVSDAVEYCVQMLRTLPNEVLFVLRRVAMVPQGRTIAEYASIFRSEQGLAELAESKQCSIADIINNAVKVAVQKNLIYHNKSGFSFAHDRLQQSVMQCVSSQEEMEIRFYLGKRGLDDNVRPEKAFDVLRNFYLAKQLVTDPDLILRIGKLAVEVSSLYVTAGSQAALDEILAFVIAIIQSLHNQEVASALEVRLLISHHQIKFLMNDLEAAEKIFHQLQPRLNTNAEIRDAYFSRTILLANSDSNQEAIELCAQALDRLGDSSLPSGLVLEEGEPANIVQKVKLALQALYAERPGIEAEELASSLPVSNDEDHNFRVEMLISNVGSAYVLGRFDLYLYIPSIAVLKILDKGLTRSSGHAFSVLGFALCAMFNDSFGAEVAMLGNFVVQRFSNPICMCRTLCTSGIAVIFDKRYQDLASRHLYRSYASGRTAHDLLWGGYAMFLLSQMLIFEGVSLPQLVETLEDIYAYAKEENHQLLPIGLCRIVLHVAAMLMHGGSPEGQIFHYSLLEDEASKAAPLIELGHGATSVVCLYFEGKLQIAWQLITEMIEEKYEVFAVGQPMKYYFNLYAVVVAHSLLAGPLKDDTEDKGTAQLSEAQREKLIETMKTCRDELERLHTLAPIFYPMTRIAKACIVDVVDGQPLEALEIFESVANGIREKGNGKHQDIIAISRIESARICQRKNLKLMNRQYLLEAAKTLEKWGARSAATRYRKGIVQAQTIPTVANTNASVEIASSISGRPPGEMQSSATTQTRKSMDSMTTSQFESILEIANKLNTSDKFDELIENLSLEILKHSRATRLLLLMRQGDSAELEPVAHCTSQRICLSQKELENQKYSRSIMRVTDKLKESTVVHAAGEESPYCFEPYVQESGIQSIASLPITHQNSVIAMVYLEHEFLKGAFTPDITATLALLGQHVASAMVNTHLLRDLRVRSVQLEQSHALLAKALRVKDTILSNTSHELRSPLNGIIGLNESILVDKKLDPEVEHCVETTLSMAKQLLILVGDILDMSKINEGSLTLNYETQELRPLVEEVLAVSRFSGKNVAVINNVDKNFEVLIDPVRLKQVLLNLVSNGVKFTPEGSVTVTAELNQDAGLFTISVADTGIGISAEQLDTIFEPFAQILAYETKDHEGTGLGLSIAKRLVELHGGRLDVTTKVGVGSTFQIIIPTVPPGTSGNGVGVELPEKVSAATPATTHPSEPTSSFVLSSEGSKSNKKPDVKSPNGGKVITQTNVQQQPAVGPKASERGKQKTQEVRDDSYTGKGKLARSVSTDDSIDKEPLRVLAVDDTAINLKILRNFLEKAGMIVSTATNGKQLLEMIVECHWTDYDVVLLDWMMPIMDGVTALAILRERIPTELLPVLFLTAKTDSGALEKGFEVGATDFITKPLNRKEVIARTLCQGHASRRARARFFDSTPIVPYILSHQPFWKLYPTSGSRDMFVVCLHATSIGSSHRYDKPSLPVDNTILDGPALLHYFQLQPTTFNSNWRFYELAEDSVTFLSPSTTVEQIKAFVRTIVSAWAEDISSSTSSSSDKFSKPCIKVGVDYRPVHAHLFGERLPMLAVVESCSIKAQSLAREATKHEEVSLSESALAKLETISFDKK